MKKSKHLMERVAGLYKGMFKRRYIKLFVTGALMVAMVGGTLIETNAVYSISVDGKEIGAVSSKEELARLMDTVDEELTVLLDGEYDADSSLENVKVVKGFSAGSAESEDDIRDAIMESVDGVSKLYTVYVDGEPAGAMDSEEEAQTILDDIKSKYSPINAESTEFVQDVKIVNECVNEAKLGVTSAELAEMLDPENEGSEFHLSVKSTATVKYSEAVEYPTITNEDDAMYEGDSETVTEGVDGSADITALRTYINGEEKSDVILSKSITEEPVAEVISIGTAERPATASYGEFIWPTDGILTSDFGSRSVAVGSSQHKGIDIGGKMDQDILAADGGEVILAEWYSGYGNYIQIKHDDGTVTAYGHCNELFVTQGDRVFRGQVIAAMGETGVASGVHLHFEVIIDGEHVSPLDYLP